MSKKRVLMQIAGKEYMVTGADSEKRLRQIERGINEKIDALRSLLSVQSLEEDYLIMLTAINIADDYLTEKEQVAALQEQVKMLQAKEKELQKTIDQYEEDLMNLETENQEYAARLKQLKEEQN